MRSVVIFTLLVVMAFVSSAKSIELYKVQDKWNETQKAAKEIAPKLFDVNASIVIFTSKSCLPCRRQKLELRRPSEEYNIDYIDVNTEKGRKLYRLYEFATGVPRIIVFEKGIIDKTFIGYTPWETIKPHAEKAKK